MVKVTGGDKLGSFLKNLIGKADNASSVEIGWQEGADYPDTGVSIGLVAAINEYGAPSRGIPPRPFFRGMIAKEKGHWGDDLAGFLKASNYDAKQALGSLGAEIQSELTISIYDFSGVPLKPATIKAKGFDKQLIDTARMAREVKHVVK